MPPSRSRNPGQHGHHDLSRLVVYGGLSWLRYFIVDRQSSIITIIALLAALTKRGARYGRGRRPGREANESRAGVSDLLNIRAPDRISARRYTTRTQRLERIDDSYASLDILYSGDHLSRCLAPDHIAESSPMYVGAIAG